MHSLMGVVCLLDHLLDHPSVLLEDIASEEGRGLQFTMSILHVLQSEYLTTVVFEVELVLFEGVDIGEVVRID